MKRLKIYSLTEKVNHQADVIVNHLDEELLSVYVFLVNVFSMSDVTENLVFQFVYRSFYQFDKAPLNPTFKQDYFRLMQKYRYENDLQLEEIAKQLCTYIDEKNDPTLEISYTTKLINMINANYPIYNRNIDRVFRDIIEVSNKPIHKFDLYVLQHKKIMESYERIIAEKMLEEALVKFDEKFPLYDLPLTKKLDFIFTTYGKLLAKEKYVV